MAKNWLETSIVLIWDTFLPGVIPVTLYVTVQGRVTEVTEDTVHVLLSVLVPHQTLSAPGGPSTVLPRLYCFAFLLTYIVILVHVPSQNQLSTTKGELVSPRARNTNKASNGRWTSRSVGINVKLIPVIKSTTIIPEGRTHTLTKSIFFFPVLKSHKLE